MGPASRRVFAGSVVAAAALVAGRATGKAAQFEFKCTSDFPPTHPSTIRMAEMWSAVERESGGRVHMQFYPNSSLGSASSTFAQLRVGAIQFQMLGLTWLSSVLPVADIAFLGFVFKDAAEGLRVFDGPLGGYMRQEVATKNIVQLRSMWDSGMLQLTSGSHPIRTPDDLHGFKVRIQESRIAVDLFKTLGAIPTPLATGEVYTALQTKITDGTSSPLVSIQAQKWFEVQKFISLTNHSWNGMVVIANGDVWKTLPVDIQAIIERNNTKYALLERADTNAINNAAAAQMAQQGVVINRVAQEPFRALLKPYFETWATTFGPTAMGLLQNSLGRKLT